MISLSQDAQPQDAQPQDAQPQDAQPREAQPTGRERKKLATRLAIRQAALALAVDRGVDHVTVEEISEAAEVSPRTFFNYFACKEDALVGENEEVSTELHDMIVGHLVDAAPLSTVRAAFNESELLHMARARRDDALARQRLVHENPSLLPRQIAKYMAIERTLADAMAERLGVDPEEDLRPALTAAIATTVVRVAMQRWTTHGTRRPDELIDEAFDLLENSL